MEKIVFLRHSPDWRSMTEESFLDQDIDLLPVSKEWWNKALLKMYQQVKWWNMFCSVSYFDYRQRLKDITLKNIKRTNHSLFLDKKKEIDGPFIFIASDDDDWFHPNIFEIIDQHVKCDTELVVWKSYWYKIDVLAKRGVEKVFTNNYALTHNLRDKSILFDDLPSTSDILWSGQLKTVNIDEFLSFTNKTIASASIMMGKYMATKRDFVDTIIRFGKRVNNEIDWISEEFEMMNVLNESLKIKDFI